MDLICIFKCCIYYLKYVCCSSIEKKPAISKLNLLKTYKNLAFTLCSYKIQIWISLLYKILVNSTINIKMMVPIEVYLFHCLSFHGNIKTTKRNQTKHFKLHNYFLRYFQKLHYFKTVGLSISTAWYHSETVL